MPYCTQHVESAVTRGLLRMNKVLWGARKRMVLADLHGGREGNASAQSKQQTGDRLGQDG